MLRGGNDLKASTNGFLSRKKYKNIEIKKPIMIITKLRIIMYINTNTALPLSIIETTPMIKAKNIATRSGEVLKKKGIFSHHQ
jgi:hypothetical protein